MTKTIKGGGAKSPRERFIEVAEPRVARALDAIRMLSTMNRAEYNNPSFHSDVEQMIGEIERAIGELKETYRRPIGAPKAGFRFDPEPPRRR